MICKSCKSAVDELDSVCPFCKNEILLDSGECLTLWNKAVLAKRNKEYELYYKLCERLADGGFIPAVREWGSILESGELGEANLDGAMRCFKIGADRCDAYSAYRYSRLVGRESEERSNFWLLFSAVLGCHEAAPAAARLLDLCGGTAEASYYYSLSAKCDNIDSIVTLAKRYSEGIGVPKSDAYAKWYMDKLPLPPIHALKLAYRLRVAVACEPPEPECNIRELISRLAFSARAYGFGAAERRLRKMLADMGDTESQTRLGILLAEGVGGDADMPSAINILENAAIHGSAEAYKILGNLYLTGKGCEKSAERALFYYRHAAEYGISSAYQIMADIYYEGELVERDVAKAASLYELAANEGDAEAKRKLDLIVKKRTELYTRGIECERTSGAEAFAAYTLAVAMGHIPAYTALAHAYLVGIGTEINRRRAHSLLKTAADLGDTTAYFPLALCYTRGVGTRLDYKTARIYLAKARALIDKRADSELQKILEAKLKKLSGQFYSRAMRLIYMHKFELAKSACETADVLRCAKATYTLGTMYEFGLGVMCDKELAYSLYERAYKNGFRDPRNEYKLSVLKLVKKRDMQI